MTLREGDRRVSFALDERSLKMSYLAQRRSLILAMEASVTQELSSKYYQIRYLT